MKRLLILFLTFVAPIISHAAFADFKDFVDTVMTTYVGRIIDLFSVLALAVFIWGLIRFLYTADSDEGRRAGKQRMVWGIVALFVLVSIQGLILFLQNTFLLN